MHKKNASEGKVVVSEKEDIVFARKQASASFESTLQQAWEGAMSHSSDLQSGQFDIS